MLPIHSQGSGRRVQNKETSAPATCQKHEHNSVTSRVFNSSIHSSLMCQTVSTSLLVLETSAENKQQNIEEGAVNLSNGSTFDDNRVLSVAVKTTDTFQHYFSMSRFGAVLFFLSFRYAFRRWLIRVTLSFSLSSFFLASIQQYCYRSIIYLFVPYPSLEINFIRLHEKIVRS